MRRIIVVIPLAALALLAACGGGDSTLSGGGGGGTNPTGNNVAAMTVDAGPIPTQQPSVNTAFVSVTVCTPGSTTNCQTIDHIEVDTQSYGLRIISSVLNSTLVLNPETYTAGNNGPIWECAVFGDGYSWGSVQLADMQIAGESASNIPIQVIGDPAVPLPPQSCSSSGGSEEDTVATFGANGIIGVGPFVQDEQVYYSCPGGVCSEIAAMTLDQEVANPVASFATDNNGVIVELPTVSSSGATSLAGSLVFGIGTEANNALGAATVYTVDPNVGTLNITFNGSTYANSYIDSGSNANYFAGGSIPVCSDEGFYCPTSTLSLTAIITGINAASTTVDFSVANADSLFSGNPSGVAFVNLAAPNPIADSFDFGLPFFFGNKVFTAIAGQTTPGGIGPYVAF
jgi:hypothetical protein